ncbi:MAG: FAD-dependent oxidoreductase [Deltaproteobacteria bacterium]|nr:FAD-dependent oxidoreductase [Deltaproteobacteria bacterium]
MTRRDLLAAIGAGWLADAGSPSDAPFGGALLGADHRIGHWLRDGASLPLDGPTETCDVVVIGSGASGASAAWRLAACGVEVRMLDLEPRPGGTSAWGEGGVVAHPWGAHYLPAPNVEARATLRLLEELGAVLGRRGDGTPIFREKDLCHAPDERLFYRGEWRPSLVPMAQLEPRDREELQRFLALRGELRQRVGRDGRAAFTIPVGLSSQDPELLELDRMTMGAWLAREGFTSPFLRWYVEYATLDDFGASLDEVSAWAGLHYFGARKLETEQLQGSHYLVWPEGNGRLVRHMLDQSQPRRQQRMLVTRIEPGEKNVAVEALDVSRERPLRRRFFARAVVVAVPGFVASRLVPSSAAERLVRREAAPWVVANLHVRMPVEPNRAWDSVIHGSRCLGYVDAGHQRTRPSEETVLTYFRAHGDADVRGVRAKLLDRRWSEHAADVLLDLAAPHPDLARTVSRLDVMVWGHAMPRPRPGFLAAGNRSSFEPRVWLDQRVAWAHVDQSGLALFEEANAAGVRAGEAVAAKLGAPRSESWL